MSRDFKSNLEMSTVEVTLPNGKKARIAKVDEDLFKKALKLDKSKHKAESKIKEEPK